MLMTLALLAVTTVSTASQQTAQEILATAAEKKAQRLAAVENYTIIQRVQGTMESPLYYEAMGLGADGMPMYRVVPTTEWQRQDPRNAGGEIDMAAFAPAMGAGVRMLSEGTMAQLSGSPIGSMIPAGGMEKWLDDMDTFLGAAAQARSRENDGRADATKAGVDMADFAERARFVGMEAVRGREAFLLRVDDVSGIPEQQMGDATFVIERGSLWIDKQYYVQLRLRMEGRMEAAGKPSVPIVIELEELDFVYIPPLYEPRRKVMRLNGLMGGMAMDPKQAQKLAKAQADMEKMKVQLAQLTPQQRAMVQGQVDKAEAMMAQMTGGNDVVETEVEYMVYSINKGPPFNWRPFCPSLEPDAPKFPTIPGGPATQPACGTL